MTCPVVILAGGMGTRLREETEVLPKPMVEIGGRPILWHIMKTYTAFGCREFVICLGYKGDYIKDFFLNYTAHHGSLSLDLATGETRMHTKETVEPWTVHLLETGSDTMTGGRIRRAAQFLGPRRFFATYGDGVADIDLHKLMACHEASGKTATITAVRPPARFGGLTMKDGHVVSFDEKNQINEGWINGGYMVLEPQIAQYIDGDDSILERGPMEALAAKGQLAAYEHDGFWQCMDTLRDLTTLRDIWNAGAPPWKVW
jgi:glucose-1-phosphate cytidylyltransferase